MSLVHHCVPLLNRHTGAEAPLYSAIRGALGTLLRCVPFGIAWCALTHLSEFEHDCQLRCS